MTGYTILGVPILTFLTFFPTVGALLILLLPSSKRWQSITRHFPRTVRAHRSVPVLWFVSPLLS